MVDPARRTEDTVARTIGAIYDAALAPERWQSALEQVRQLFCLGSAALVVHNADRTKVQGWAAGVEASAHQNQITTGMFRNSLVYRRHHGYAGEVIRAFELVPAEKWQRSPMYQEYWRPRGFHDGMRLTVSVDVDGIHHAINLLRHKSGSLIDADDIEPGAGPACRRPAGRAPIARNHRGQRPQHQHGAQPAGASDGKDRHAPAGRADAPACRHSRTGKWPRTLTPAAGRAAGRLGPGK
jgi:hypothetical protein